MSGAWRRYTKLVEQFPWASQIVQTGLICATGDAVAQLTVERKNLKVTKLPVLGSDEHLQPADIYDTYGSHILYKSTMYKLYKLYLVSERYLRTLTKCEQRASS